MTPTYQRPSEPPRIYPRNRMLGDLDGFDLGSTVEFTPDGVLTVKGRLTQVQHQEGWTEGILPKVFLTVRNGGSRWIGHATQDTAVIVTDENGPEGVSDV